MCIAGEALDGGERLAAPETGALLPQDVFP